VELLALSVFFGISRTDEVILMVPDWHIEADIDPLIKEQQ
jgi:hypothetical protein